MKIKLITKKKLFLNILFCLILTFFSGSQASAITTDEMLWGGYQGQFESKIGLGKADPRDMIVNLLKVAMTFLGLLAVIIIMLAGFKWMVSGGNEDKAAEAKKMISGAILGIIIMLASYGIVNFIINSMFDVTSTTVL